MAKRVWKTGLLLGGATMSLWIGFAGCAGSKSKVYCETVCDCQGCAESVREQCESTMVDAEKAAEDKGCNQEYRDVLQCLIEDSQCVNDQLDTKACDSEMTAYQGCQGTTGLGKNACEIYVDHITTKLEGCGFDVSGSGDPSAQECTPALAKQAACFDGCVDLMDCACLQDPTGSGCNDVNQKYADCVSACQ